MSTEAKIRDKPQPPPKPSHLSQTTTNTQQPLSNQKSKKRGLGWPWDFPGTLFPLFTNNDPSPKISWLFNWELWIPPSTPDSIEWIPCVRTAAQCKDIIPFLTPFRADGNNNQTRPVTHLLGFNEPEIPSQANLGVDEAVRLWREFVLPAKQQLGLRLGSPGMSSDEARSVAWLDGFFQKLGGVQSAGVEFLVVHWYGPRFGDMRRFLEMMHGRYQLPVWINEFACSTMGNGEASQEAVEAFLKEALPWLEECEFIERYAYFGNGQGMDVGSWVGRASNFLKQADRQHGIEGKQLSETGKLYLGF